MATLNTDKVIKLVKQYVSDMKNPKFLTECVVYAAMLMVASYQCNLLISEYVTSCATAVSFSEQRRLQIPALTLCVPIQDVVFKSIELSLNEGAIRPPGGPSRTTVEAMQTFLQNCHGFEVKMYQKCALSLIRKSGLMPVYEWFKFIKTDSHHYFRLYTSVDGGAEEELFTPMITWVSDICYTYYYKSALTYSGPVSVDDPEGDALLDPGTPLKMAENVVQNFFYQKFDIVRNPNATPPEGEHFIQAILHSPLERPTSFSRFKLLENGYGKVFTFNYMFMSHRNCPSMRCRSYDDIADQLPESRSRVITPAVVSSSVRGNLRLLDERDMLNREVARRIVDELGCFPFGTLRSGPTLRDFEIYPTVPHCESDQSKNPKHMSVIDFWTALYAGGSYVSHFYQDCEQYSFLFQTVPGNSYSGIPYSTVQRLDTTVSHIVITPDPAPFLAIRRESSMTGIAFIAQACGLLGIWFGVSILSFARWSFEWGPKIKKILLRKRILIKAPEEQTTKEKSAKARSGGHNRISVICNQIQNNQFNCQKNWQRMAFIKPVTNVTMRPVTPKILKMIYMK